MASNDREGFYLERKEKRQPVSESPDAAFLLA
jgi:hypothetical protein